MTHTGGCLCGAVRFTASDADAQVHACHCSMCRRWNGGPGLSVAVGSIEFDGADDLARYPSSDWAERGFCRRCGSNLFYRLKEADHYIVSLGAFDDQDRFRLAGEIFIDEKPASYAFAGEHPRMTGEEFLASLQQS